MRSAICELVHLCGSFLVDIAGGNAPRGFDPKLPNPVPIFTVDVTLDPLLEVRKGACKVSMLFFV